MMYQADRQPITAGVEEWMQMKRRQPGFGKRRYGVIVRVGRAEIRLHKSAR